MLDPANELAAVCNHLCKQLPKRSNETGTSQFVVRTPVVKYINKLNVPTLGMVERFVKNDPGNQTKLHITGTGTVLAFS